jgi:hypothetical protein
MTFLKFLKAFRSIWGGAALAAAGGPIILWASELDPPWPPNSASKITTLFCAVAILLSYFINRVLAEKQQLLNSKHRFVVKQLSGVIGSIFLVIGLLFGGAYLWIYGKFVVTDTIQTKNNILIVRKVVGDKVRKGINSETTTNIDLLRDHLYDEEAIWTADSLQKARMSLLVTFSLTFFSITFGTAMLATMDQPQSKNTDCRRTG